MPINKDEDKDKKPITETQRVPAQPPSGKHPSWFERLMSIRYGMPDVSDRNIGLSGGASAGSGLSNLIGLGVGLAGEYLLGGEVPKIPGTNISIRPPNLGGRIGTTPPWNPDPNVPIFDHGGTARRRGLAIVDAGELMIPRNRLNPGIVESLPPDLRAQVSLPDLNAPDRPPKPSDEQLTQMAQQQAQEPYLPALDAYRKASAEGAPPPPKFPWWQRAVAAGLGGLTGYARVTQPQIPPSNVSFSNPAPLFAPDYEQKKRDYATQLEGLQQAAQAEQMGQRSRYEAAQARRGEALHNLQIQKLEWEMQKGRPIKEWSPAERKELADKLFKPGSPEHNKLWIEGEILDPQRTPVPSVQQQEREDLLGAAAESIGVPPDQLTAAQRVKATAVERVPDDLLNEAARLGALPENAGMTKDQLLAEARISLASRSAKVAELGEKNIRSQIAARDDRSRPPSQDEISAVTARKDNALKRITTEIQNELKALEGETSGGVGGSRAAEIIAKETGGSGKSRRSIIEKHAKSAQAVQDRYEDELARMVGHKVPPFDMYAHVMRSWGVGGGTTPPSRSSDSQQPARITSPQTNRPVSRKGRYDPATGRVIYD